MMMESPLHRFFSNSADAVFGIDWSGRISFWNEQCTRITGLTIAEVGGKRCCEVFNGTDLDGTPRCRQGCEVSRQMAQGTSIPNYDMVIKDKDGASMVVNVSVFATPVSMKSEVDIAGFLVLRRLNYQRLIQRLVAESKHREKTADDRQIRLSSREIEVLRLAADGLNTKKIAERLSLSDYTVKNHFASILAKLKVHSRAEAVSQALRMNLF
jgi:PAS domain S-box-containing protein